jgi:hypothetical protein
MIRIMGFKLVETAFCNNATKLKKAEDLLNGEDRALKKHNGNIYKKQLKKLLVCSSTTAMNSIPPPT